MESTDRFSVTTTLDGTPVTPSILLPSKTGLRTRFSFLKSCRIATAPAPYSDNYWPDWGPVVNSDNTGPQPLGNAAIPDFNVKGNPAVCQGGKASTPHGNVIIVGMGRWQCAIGQQRHQPRNLVERATAIGRQRPRQRLVNQSGGNSLEFPPFNSFVFNLIFLFFRYIMTKIQRIRLYTSTFAIVCAIAIAGCGQSKATVSGKISLKGKALNGGFITFHGDSGRQSFSSQIDEAGSYKIDSALSGTYRISITTVQSTTMGPDMMAMKMKMGGGKSPLPGGGGALKGVKNEPPKGAVLPQGYEMSTPSDGTKKITIVPEQYSDCEKSGLTATLNAGDNVHNIELN